MTRQRVLILGGGFAGLACANTLSSRDFDVTLVDRKADFEFLPNIHELVSAVKTPGQLKLPLAACMRAAGHRFIRGEVRDLDPATKTLIVGARRKLSADYLVVAAGSADADYGVPGVSDNSLGFKSVQQCQAIHRQLQHVTGAGRVSGSKQAPRIVIVGGGLEGIEALGEVLRRYRNRALRISLVEARPSLLPEMPAAVGRHIAGHCAQWNVELITGDAVTRITPRTVLLKSGRRLQSAATIWTGGPTPPPLLAEAGLCDTRQWAPVNDWLEHREFAGVYIAGDAAGLEQPINKQAYHALDMGRCVAGNIERAARGRRGRRYRPAAKPTLLAFGDLDTVLISERLTLAGPALAAAKEAIYAAVMAQLDQRAPQDRLFAALGRGREATRQLLWPSVNNWKSLRRQAQLQRLT
jgi:NADH dehydrogenase